MGNGPETPKETPDFYKEVSTATSINQLKGLIQNRLLHKTEQEQTTEILKLRQEIQSSEKFKTLSEEKKMQAVEALTSVTHDQLNKVRTQADQTTALQLQECLKGLAALRDDVPKQRPLQTSSTALSGGDKTIPQKTWDWVKRNGKYIAGALGITAAIAVVSKWLRGSNDESGGKRGGGLFGWLTAAISAAAVSVGAVSAYNYIRGKKSPKKTNAQKTQKPQQQREQKPNKKPEEQPGGNQQPERKEVINENTPKVPSMTIVLSQLDINEGTVTAQPLGAAGGAPTKSITSYVDEVVHQVKKNRDIYQNIKKEEMPKQYGRANISILIPEGGDDYDNKIWGEKVAQAQSYAAQLRRKNVNISVISNKLKKGKTAEQMKQEQEKTVEADEQALSGSVLRLDFANKKLITKDGQEVSVEPMNCMKEIYEYFPKDGGEHTAFEITYSDSVDLWRFGHMMPIIVQNVGVPVRVVQQSEDNEFFAATFYRDGSTARQLTRQRNSPAEKEKAKAYFSPEAPKLEKINWNIETVTPEEFDPIQSRFEQAIFKFRGETRTIQQLIELIGSKQNENGMYLFYSREGMKLKKEERLEKMNEYKKAKISITYKGGERDWSLQKAVLDRFRDMQLEYQWNPDISLYYDRDPKNNK